MRAELDRLKAERDEYAKTVSRIWAALGLKTYGDAKGMDISELVATHLAQEKVLEARVEELTQALTLRRLPHPNAYAERHSGDNQRMAPAVPDVEPGRAQVDDRGEKDSL